MFNQSRELLEPKIRRIIEEGYTMNTCFLLTHVPDPKTNKRIDVFKRYGEVYVICTRRKSQDIWEPAHRDIKHYIFDIDLPTAKRIVKRYIISRTFQRKALKKLRELRPDVIYADGLDSLLIAARYKKEHPLKLFYDVADLRETYIEEPESPFKKLLNNIVKQIEKKCFINVDHLVVTSEKFYTVYYHRLIAKDKVIYIPNAPDKEIFKNYKKKKDGDFTIGFIGGIRYLDQMKMLVDAAGECGCKVFFAGAGGTSEDYKEITKYCKEKTYVTFSGRYEYERDIAKLYGQVDCVFAVYNADNANVRIALPNKLYESVLCGLPIIVAKNTYLSEIVEEWGVGLAVNHKDKDELKLILKYIAEDEEFRKNVENNCKIIMGISDINQSNTLLEKSISKKWRVK